MWIIPLNLTKSQSIWIRNGLEMYYYYTKKDKIWNINISGNSAPLPFFIKPKSPKLSLYQIIPNGTRMQIKTIPFVIPNCIMGIARE